MPEPGLPRVGHDLVDVARFQSLVEARPERYEARVFSPAEWALAAARPDRWAALAARFAAKEAALKVLGTGWGQGVAWTDVEVLGGGRTAPELKLGGEAARVAGRLGLRLTLSISHTDALASAVVIGYPVDAPLGLS
jgi:holo-[acyl-carrier protein] synthase